MDYQRGGAVLKEQLIQAFEDSVKNGLPFKSVREKYIQQFDADGFPTVKDEEWKYTNLLPLTKKDYAFENTDGSINKKQLEEFILTDTDSYFLVFVNGVLSKEISTITEELLLWDHSSTTIVKRSLKSIGTAACHKKQTL